MVAQVEVVDAAAGGDRASERLRLNEHPEPTGIDLALGRKAKSTPSRAIVESERSTGGASSPSITAALHSPPLRCAPHGWRRSRDLLNATRLASLRISARSAELKPRSPARNRALRV
jgi:hypothetical protein